MLTVAGAPVTDATRQTIDGTTDMATGPATTDAGATTSQPISLDGYGIAIYGFDMQ
jgi:hypothetical protein